MCTRAIVMLIVSCSICFADVSFVLTTKDDSPVYRNYTRSLIEQPLFKADRNETFQVIAEKGEMYRVVDKNGRNGWIEKCFCVKSQTGRRFEFEPEDVKGYSEVPTFGIVIDHEGKDEIPLQLERSFKEELKENIDKENVKRVTDN